jgi:hypothetical protein
MKPTVAARPTTRETFSQLVHLFREPNAVSGAVSHRICCHPLVIDNCGPDGQVAHKLTNKLFQLGHSSTVPSSAADDFVLPANWVTS